MEHELLPWPCLRCKEPPARLGWPLAGSSRATYRLLLALQYGPVWDRAGYQPVLEPAGREVPVRAHLHVICVFMMQPVSCRFVSRGDACVRYCWLLQMKRGQL